MEGLIEQSLSAQSVEDVHQLCSSICHRLGFEHFIYGARFPTSFVNPDYVIISGFPAQWWSHYNAEGYMQIDPTVAHCTTRVIPLRWDQINPGEGREAGKVRRFMSEAWEHGLRGGASFPVHGSLGESAMLSLVIDSDANGTQRHLLETMAIGQMLSGYVHEAVRRIVVDKSIPIGKVRLTQRERECLTWAAEGKTAWETGQILNISERTVIFHLQNAAEKLQVVNRPQAVARAVSQQLITPQLGRS
ncbi:MAG: LuxR family transcriptional regulator [Gammaproteobacteria bacterium]|nr:LuxR family transcriptional regulator [Gammaproteobacteria bacterium]